MFSFICYTHVQPETNYLVEEIMQYQGQRNLFVLAAMAVPVFGLNNTFYV